MKPSRRRLDDRSADALLSGRPVPGEPQLTAFVAEARAVPAELPSPTAGLAALLEHGVVPEVLDRSPVILPAPVRRAVSWRYALVALGVAGVSVLGAGAANALPAPAQRAVADVVNWFSPLNLPQPDSDQDQPAVVPTATPTPTPEVEQTETPAPAPTTVRSPEPAEGGDHDGTGVRETPSAHDGDSTSSDGDATESPQPEATPSSGGSSDASPDPDSSSGSGSSDSGSSSSTGSLESPASSQPES